MKIFHLPSLRCRLMLIMGVAVIPALGFILYTTVNERRNAEAEIRRETLELAGLFSGSLERIMEGQRHLLITLSQIPAVRNRDASSCNAILAGIAENLPLYALLGALEPNGDAFCSTVPLVRKVNATDRSWFRRTADRKEFAVGEYQLGRVTGVQTISSSLPVLDRDGNVLAVVMASISLEAINKRLIKEDLPPETNVVVIDRNGTILARHPEFEKWVGKPFPDTGRIKDILGKKQGTDEFTGDDGRSRVCSFSEVADSDGGLHVIIGIPKDVVFGRINEMLVTHLLWYGLIAFLLFIIVWYGSDAIILSRVRRLLQATKKLASGDLSVRSGIQRGEDEISELSVSFDRMADEISKRTEDYRKATERYEGFLQASPEAIVNVTPDGVVTLWNKAAEQMFGWKAEETLGRLNPIVPADKIDDYKKNIRRILAGEALTGELQRQRKDGSAICLTISNAVFHDDKGDVTEIMGIIADVTERKRAEEALRLSEGMYRSIAHNFPNGAVALFDKDLRFLIADGRAVGVAGPPRELVEGRTIWEAFPPEFCRMIEPLYRETIAGKETVVETSFGEFTFQSHYAPVRNEKGEILAGLVISVDITERKKAEEELRRRTEELILLNREIEDQYRQLHLLSARVVETEEMERRRIARELHDQVGQSLTALGINLNIVRSQLPPESAGLLAPRIEDSLSLVDQTTEHIRFVMAELRPPVLDDYGLFAATKWYGEQFSARTGIQVVVSGAEPSPRYPLSVENNLFRIVQEALTNVAKHSEAKAVSISLREEARLLRLSISDKGKGFVPNRAEPNMGHGWGILNMRERARSAGGILRIESTPGRGTEVVVEVGR